MSRIMTAVAVVALMIAAGFGATAEAAGPFSETVSGNFVDTAIDTNADGVAAASYSGGTKGFRGGASYSGLQEVQFTPTGLCEAGEVEGKIVAYSIVRRFSNGDLMYSRLVDGSFCFDPSTGKANVAVSAEITGGTGHFEGTTGSYELEYEVTGLLPDPTGGLAHGAFVGTISGTIDE
jgi:hypothetical protein